MWLPGTNVCGPEDWVQATRTLPIAFAQVREDPFIDAQLVRSLDRPARILMVASGGETAALLSTLPIECLHLVDMNQAQLDLTRLKLQLLTTAETDERLRLLGHLPMPAQNRSRELTRRLEELELSAHALGPAELVARFGPDFCGRYEWLFARLRQHLASHGEEVRHLMMLRDPQRQAQLVAEGTDLGIVLQDAFAETMELSRLVRIFGPDATANRVQPFASHFLSQTRNILSQMPAADNPFLHQIFLGSFLGKVWPWLEASSDAAPQTRFTHAAMSDVLTAEPGDSYDLIHLSNILDWIKPAEAQAVLSHAHRCLAAGGLVVIRQLNSQLDIRSLPSGLDWMSDLSDQLHRTDRSFFYRSLHVGAKV